ncbi:MAG: T9SS type A sorting domain-containing protein, partial [Ignavibacteriales bacterium]|nr:T9SS type A sorting domain-containing protein [Ignavibacteriales bacterium]
MYSGSATWTRSAMDEVGWTGIDPANDNNMYASWRGGSTLYKSTNRGVSFFSSGSFSTVGAWNAPFVISPSNPSVIYFGKQKIFRTTNAGSSWSATNSNINIDGNPTLSMAISKTNENIVYIGTAPYATRAQVWKTINGGTSWQNITGTLPDRYPNDIIVDPNNSDIAYVAFGGFGSGHFYKTTDGGTSWTNITGILPDVPGTAVMVDPLNSNNIFAGNDLGVFLSTDGGTTWNNFSDGLPDAVLVSDITYSPSNRVLRVATHGNGVFERKLPATLPALSLVTPNGSELWEATSTQIIEWSPLVISLVRLEYSSDNGSSWMMIADSLPASQSSYEWNIPATLTNTALVRVTSLDNPTLFDLSDASFTIYFAGAIISENAGWNLVSLPLNVNDPRTTTVFPTAVSSAIKFDDEYIQKDSMMNGIGYWLKFNSTQSVIIRGDSVHTDSLDVVEGWNLIGSVSIPISTSSIIEEPSNIISTGFFGYNGGYENAMTVEPGKGYWVKANSEGKLILTNAVLTNRTTNKSDFENKFNRLTIQDIKGNKQNLYFGVNEDVVLAQKFELPPPPPSGIFDARFTSQKMLEVIKRDEQTELSIKIQSDSFPLSISWEIVQSGSINWNLHTNKSNLTLVGSGSITFNENESENLRLTNEKSLSDIPNQTNLLQNFPNPFNPQTTIRFELKSEGNASLKIFNVLGKEIAELMNSKMKSGYHEISWNATEFPSGVYIVQFRNNNLSFHKRILLMR